MTTRSRMQNSKEPSALVKKKKIIKKKLVTKILQIRKRETDSKPIMVTRFSKKNNKQPCTPVKMKNIMEKKSLNKKKISTKCCTEMVTNSRIQQKIKTAIKLETPRKCNNSKMVTRNKKQNNNQFITTKKLKKTLQISQRTSMVEATNIAPTVTTN